MKAEYSNPKECGKFNSEEIFIFLSAPTPYEVVDHSPTPSIVKMQPLYKGKDKMQLRHEIDGAQNT